MRRGPWDVTRPRRDGFQPGSWLILIFSFERGALFLDHLIAAVQAVQETGQLLLAFLGADIRVFDSSAGTKPNVSDST